VTKPGDEVTSARVPAQQSTERDDFLDGDVPAETPAETPATLDERGQQILEFEKRWWRQAGAKEQAIKDTFGLSSTRYYQLLNQLLDDPKALAHDAMVVQRLRRLRASRHRQPRMDS
jgi:hypothetical protein